jgi:squalene-hopene/tetraprenyl-beta-curcumene cyclase
MIKLINFLLVTTLLLTGCTSPNTQRSVASGRVSPEEVKFVVNNLKTKISAQKKYVAPGDAYYDMPAYLGTYITSMYFLSLIFTKEYQAKSKYPKLAATHKKLLYKTQNTNGGWHRMFDASIKDHSDLSVTIIHYWFLKATGEDIHSSKMRKARKFILDNGSLDKSDMFTKIFLSMFLNYDWNKIPKIPYLVFNPLMPINDRSMAQWLSPHLLPISILRKLRVAYDLGEKLSLKELTHDKSVLQDLKPLTSSDVKMINKFISKQHAKGSWGGYITTAILGNMILYHASQMSTELNTVAVQKKAKNFADQYIFNVGTSSFLGTTQDGHIWDSILLTGALVEAGDPKKKSMDVIAHLKANQMENGGIPFGYGFEEFPDVDDTAELILTLLHFTTKDDPAIKKAESFIDKMQNRDGGFAAFAKDNNGNFLINLMAKDFKDTADLFDESSSDVTAHVLEAYGKLGYDQKNSRQVRGMVKYLRKQQTDDGAFLGRWGVNYIYGTGAVLAALSEIDLPENDPMTQNAINWLISKQNEDGGFGESTLSYGDVKWRGVGVSTPSQTAWALIGLLPYLPVDHPTIQGMVSYLVKDYRKNKNDFVDQSTTGTGHPNVCYMVYPSYAKAFPLMALSRYLKKL